MGALTAAKADGRYATIEDIGEASSILLVGNDPTHQHPLIAYQIRQAVRHHDAHLYLLNSHEIKLQRQAKQSVTVPAGGEAEAIRVLAGKPSPASDRVAANAGELASLDEKLRKESGTIIIFGDEIRGKDVADLVQWGLTLPGRTRFVALGDYANSRGAADMGLLPDVLPGYAALSDPAARERMESAWQAKIPTAPGRNIRSILARRRVRRDQGIAGVWLKPRQDLPPRQGASGQAGLLDGGGVVPDRNHRGRRTWFCRRPASRKNPAR